MSTSAKYSKCCGFYIECNLAGSLKKCFRKRETFKCKNFFEQQNIRIEYWRDTFVECTEFKAIFRQGLVD